MRIDLCFPAVFVIETIATAVAVVSVRRGKLPVLMRFPKDLRREELFVETGTILRPTGLSMHLDFPLLSLPDAETHPVPTLEIIGV